MNRRRWLGLTAFAALAAAGVSLWRTFRPAPARKRVPRGARMVVRGGSEIGAGDSLDFELGGCPALLVRGEDGRLRAFEATCTHLGCTVRWRQDLRAIACPCHAGRFDVDGRPTGGPPKVALDRLLVEESGGRAVVRAPEETTLPDREAKTPSFG